MCALYEDDLIRIIEIRPIIKISALSENLELNVIRCLHILTISGSIQYICLVFSNNQSISIENFARVNSRFMRAYKNIFVIPQSLDYYIVKYICDNKVLTEMFLDWPSQIYSRPLCMINI